MVSVERIPQVFRLSERGTIRPPGSSLMEHLRWAAITISPGRYLSNDYLHYACSSIGKGAIMIILAGVMTLTDIEQNEQ